MMLTPTFDNRDFTPRIAQPKVTWTINHLAWQAQGGAEEASLTAWGGENDLVDLLNWLRCPMTLYDDAAQAVWWGFVQEVRFRIGGIEVGATLTSMYNRIAVAYSFIEPGSDQVGLRKTTAWVDDTSIQAELGIRELLHSAGGLNDAAALSRRATLLEQRKRAGGVGNQAWGAARGRLRESGAENSLSATVICRGWWDTLDWKHASTSIIATAGPSFVTGTLADQNLGSVAGNTKLMQQFTTGTLPVNLKSIDVYVRKVGTPTDNLLVEVGDDTAGGWPVGVQLTSTLIAGSSLTTSSAWTKFTFATEVNLAPNTVYGITMQRSGALSATNYYVVQVDTGLGYAGGSFVLWNGSAWVSRSPDADMLFKVFVDNNIETGTQMIDLVTRYGQFISGVELEAATGVKLPNYLNGEKRALEVIEELMTHGGVNKRRILSTVTPERKVRFWEEAAATPVYQMNRNGVLFDSIAGGEIIEYMPPVGVWVELRDLTVGNINLELINDPTLQFLERANWTPGNGLTLYWRGQLGLEELMTLQE